jgi:uncharacterized membrane protein
MSGRWDTSRIEAFSDAVFAIAITLLVLDIKVPPTALDDLWAGILHQWPAYLAFATSFITIGGIWLAHHGMFRRLQYADDRVMRLNLLLLMAVSFLPFPTRLIAEAIRNPDAERTAVIFYGTSLLVISGLGAAMWRAVVRNRALLLPEVTDAEVAAITRATAPSVGLYAAGIALALFAPRAAAFAYLVSALVGVARVRGDEAGSAVAR